MTPDEAASKLRHPSTRGLDPTCPYRHLGLHVCRNRDGDIVWPGQDCWTKSRNDLLAQQHAATLRGWQ